MVDVLERSGVVASRSAARRAIAEGGAYLNNARVTDPEARLTDDDLLHGRYVILRRGQADGRRRHHRPPDPTSCDRRRCDLTTARDRGRGVM